MSKQTYYTCDTSVLHRDNPLCCIFLPWIWLCIMAHIYFPCREVLYSSAVTPELYGGLLPLSHKLLSAMSRVH